MEFRIPKKAIVDTYKFATIIPPKNTTKRLPQSSHRRSTNRPIQSTQQRTLTRNTISDDEDDILNDSDSSNSNSTLTPDTHTRKRSRSHTSDHHTQHTEPTEPTPKRRRIALKKKKRRSKTKKVHLCAICDIPLHEDNKGKYCGESCKKEASELRKQERANAKKQCSVESQAIETRKTQNRITEVRKSTALKFGQIFAGDMNSGGRLERRIYKLCGNEISGEYTQKVRELAYNLNENNALLQRVLSGELTLKNLSLMSNLELAPKDLVQQRQETSEKLRKENTLQKKMVFGQCMDGKHFVLEDTGDKYAETQDKDIDIDIDMKDSPASTAMSVSTVSTAPSVPPPMPKEKSVERSVFDASEITQMLKDCKSTVTEAKLEDLGPLQIQRDSSDEEEVLCEEEEETVLEIPEPPRVAHYYERRVSNNVWNGWVKKSSGGSVCEMEIGLELIGGKECKLKAIVPKHLQINGRVGFGRVSECLSDLVRVSKSKFTVVLDVTCSEGSEGVYKRVAQECRGSGKGYVIDMKSKAGMKAILLPAFGGKDKSGFDVSGVERMWQCRLPKEGLWALLTVYASGKDKGKVNGPKHSNSNSNGKVKKANDKLSAKIGKSNGDKRKESNNGKGKRLNDKQRERDRNKDKDRLRDKDRQRERDRHRDSERHSNRRRGNRRESRETDKDGHKDRHRERNRKYQSKDNKYCDENRRKSVTK